MISRLGLSLAPRPKQALRETSPDSPAALIPETTAPLSPESSLAIISNQWQTTIPAPRPLNRKAAVVFEPNAVYRAVLFRILQRAGLTVEFVEQSSEMQDAIDRLNPGCVFIDCDGASQPGLALAQSVRVRRTDDERTVLIAVTGGTSREQRKARKLAGFDNYIAKPVRQEAVRALLARNSIGDGTTTTTASLAIEQRTLSELAELLEYDADAIEQLYRQFLSTASDALSSMRRWLEDEDPQRIALKAQELRSASGQTGAVRMQDICVGIETLSHGGMLTGVEALIQELSLAFEHVSRELFSPDFALRVREQEGIRYAAAGGSLRRTALSPGKLLLAEPDLLTSKFLAGALEGSGFTVVTTTSGRTALEQAALQDFQVVLLGTALPGIDGYGVLSQLRLMSNRVRMPVVLISSSGQEHEMLRAFDLGADEYLVKPLNPTEVVCRVRRFLR